MRAIRLHLIGALCACLVTLPAAPARAQSCLVVRNTCERDADATQQRCTAACAKYDNACTDTCDDGHDTTVRHCWIMQALCKERDRQALSTPAGIGNAR
jgi:hypothetical protein